jgi:hypothetical protein
VIINKKDEMTELAITGLGKRNVKSLHRQSKGYSMKKLEFLSGSENVLKPIRQ